MKINKIFDERIYNLIKFFFLSYYFSHLKIILYFKLYFAEPNELNWNL